MDYMILTAAIVSTGENEIILYGSEGEKYRISLADCKRIGLYRYVENPELLPEEIDGQMLEFLSKKLSCVKYAVYLLEFGDKSRKALMMKLKSKGYDEDTCEAAMDVLEKNGVVDDERLCGQKLVSLANAKFYGPYRLKSELMKKGFTSRQVDIAFDDAEIDFDDLLERLVGKLTLRGFPEDDKSYLALKNKLIRYGYSYESVSSVLEKFSTGY